jgi:hypothetical protein
VAQDVGSEFKPQYHTHTHKKNKSTNGCVCSISLEKIQFS